MATIKGLALKKVVNFKGHEGEACVQGDIYLKGKKVGNYSDSFMMGPPDINFDNSSFEEEANKICREYFAERPEETWIGRDGDLELLFIKLIELIFNENQFKKFAKKGYQVLATCEELNGRKSMVAYGNLEYAKSELENNAKLKSFKLYTSLSDFEVK